MTLEEFLKQSADPLYYGEQDENGVDLSIIRRNLQLTPLDRLRRGDRATTDVLSRMPDARDRWVNSP